MTNMQSLERCLALSLSLGFSLSWFLSLSLSLSLSQFPYSLKRFMPLAARPVQRWRLLGLVREMLEFEITGGAKTKAN